MAPRRPCTTSGCPNLQPCATHPRRPWAHTRSRQERGYDAAWERIRGQVLVEEPTCRWGSLANEDGLCRSSSTTADHIVPKSRGGTNARGNLRGLCARHQQIKAGREGRQARG